MRIFSRRLKHFALWMGWLLLSLAFPGQGWAAENLLDPEPVRGLLMTSTASDNKVSDTFVVPSLNLYVPEGGTPSPFLPPGPFEVVWKGFVDVDLRSPFFFQVEASGTFRLLINGHLVLRFKGQGNRSALTNPVRLKKGTNSLEAVFIPPAKGDAMVRLHWGELENMIFPLPPAALRHLPAGDDFRDGQLQHLGRNVALDRRCFHCHAVDAANPVPELTKDAPSFEGIGARRHVAWMADWIHDPRALNPEARMPRMVHGENAREEAEAMAAFLGTLHSGGEVDFAKDAKAVNVFAHLPVSTSPLPDLNPDAPLYTKLSCVECHTKPGATKDLPGMVPLRSLNRKFPPGKLAEYLRQPEAHYAWTRMPNFHLSEAEAGELAAFLLDPLESPAETTPSDDPNRIQRGRELVETRGCLNCHSGGPANRFRTLAFADLINLEGGCLNVEAHRDGSVPPPLFSLTGEERAALHRLAGVGDASMSRHVPSDFAQRHVESLWCARCHGTFDKFPDIEQMGGKLKPEWAAAFIAGEIPYKPRPWEPVRMPAFKPYAEGLAKGLAALHGFPPQSEEDSPVIQKAAEMGRQLVGKTGGFSCVSCHAVASQKATEVFEVEGINLQYATERLTPSYYNLWMLNPILLNPQTKMPMYFDGGQSPITEVLNGRAQPQLDAMWHYFLLKDAMPAPNLGEF